MLETDRWYLLSDAEKDKVEALPYGFMLRNILKYGNTLIPNEAIKKSSVKMICSALEQDLSDLGFFAEVNAKSYFVEMYGETDVIAEGKYYEQ